MSGAIGPGRTIGFSKRLIWALMLLALLLAAYANHFDNSFHFDDAHTIQGNLYLRSLRNIPLFFTDSTTFSNLPTHQVYRPLLTTTLAIDYVRGGGEPYAFHVTTFLLYVVYLAVAFTLFLRLLADRYWAFAATALYGLHPVCAETVNYIVQRADILSTLGVVAGLSLYLWKPAWRRTGLYLAPVVLALLTKPPALVFPILLFGAIYFWDSNRNASRALKDTIPALVVCAITAVFLSRMTAATFVSGGGSGGLYRITQMRVALHYFVSFFAPVGLSADSDWQLLPGLSDWGAIAGLLFLLAVGVVIYWTARGGEQWQPVAYGLIWFLTAMFPTSWMPLAEVANDHRMFFPFAGLTLAGAGALRVLLQRLMVERPAIRVATTAALCLLVVVEARATAVRNEVWRNEEKLWHDVTIKSPRNGRGLMNYGLTLMARGDTAGALRYLEQANTLLRSYFLLDINLGIAKGEAGRQAEAEAHFLRALQLEPSRYEPHFFYARWLNGRGRWNDAYSHAQLAVQNNRNALDARHLLMQLHAARAEWTQLDALARDTLQMAPGDPTATGYLEKASHRAQAAATPEDLLNRSLTLYQLGRYEDCIQAAREALRLRPDYAEAYNNIAAAYNATQRWDEGIRAADEALRIRPSFELARNNRLWALSQKQAKSTR